MTRKKKEKSVLRKEGNVYVLDLFVKVPSGATAPFKYKPMEVDATNQTADGREQRKQVTVYSLVIRETRHKNDVGDVGSETRD